MPGQQFVYFTSFSANPAISGSNVVFQGGFSNGSGSGIYTGTAGTTGASLIADTLTTAPGQTYKFSHFGAPALSGSSLVFEANLNYPSGGVYTGTVGTTGATRIADTSMTAPGQTTTFSNFNLTTAISGSNVVFESDFNNGSGSGIYTGTVGTAGAVRIVDTSMSPPGSLSNFSSFYSTTPVISGSNVAFTAAFGAGSGIYTATAGTTGFTRITDTSLNAPGQSTRFSSFSTPVISGSNVAFRANFNFSVGSGLYAGTVGGTVVSRIADTSITVPNQTVAFNGFGTYAIDGSNVAFIGNFKPGSSTVSGLFLYENGNLFDVAESGETLFGGTLSSVSIGSSALSGDDLAFTYTLTNGVSGEAIYVVPEPATWLAGALVLGAAGAPPGGGTRAGARKNAPFRHEIGRFCAKSTRFIRERDAFA